MNAIDVLKLIDAGFSREEILKLESETPGATDNPTPAPAPAQPKPIEEPKPAAEPKAASVVTDEQLEKLAQLINVGKQTIDLPASKNLDDLMANHFSELMIGKSKEEK